MVLTPLAIALGLIIGFLRGGRLDSVTKNRVAAWPLLVAGVVLQTLGESFDLPGRPIVVTAGLLCLIGCAMKNVHIAGAAVAGIGVTLNMAVLVVNGHIPVSFDALTAFGNDVTVNPAARGLWQIEGDDTSLSFLGDIVPTPVLNTPISFGDLIMLAGLAVIAMNVVLKGQTTGIDPEDLFAAEDPTVPSRAFDSGDGLPEMAPEPVIGANEIDLREGVGVVKVGPATANYAGPASGVGQPAESEVFDALFTSVPDTEEPRNS